MKTTFQCQKLRKKIDKDRIKTITEYLQTGLTMQSRDFQMNELMKSITNPLEGQIVDNEITISNYTRDDNNIGLPLNVRHDVVIILLKILKIILFKLITINQLFLLNLK